ncbi:MAG TPA: serine hydrolase [Myxococcales bacterium]
MKASALALLLSAGLLAVGASPAASGWPERLSRRVDSALAAFDGDLSLYVRDVATGEEYAHDARTPTYLSSAIKVLVMLEVLRQVDAGQLRLEDRVVFGPDDVRDGVGPVKRGPPGRVFTVRQLLALMMDYSENAAADLLMGKVGLDRLNELPRQRGVAFSEIDTLLGERRRIWAELDPKGASLSGQQILALGDEPNPDARGRLFSQMVGHTPPFTGADVQRAFQSFYAKRINSAPMREMGRLLEQVARCEGLSPSSCRLARELMSGCRTGAGRIRAGVPRDVEWDHKTGTQEHRACDVGILYPRPDHPVVVAACTRDFQDVRDAERLLREVGAAVWQTLGRSLLAARPAPKEPRPPPGGERRVKAASPPVP